LAAGARRSPAHADDLQTRRAIAAFPTVSIIGTTKTLAPIGMLFPGDPGVHKGGVFTPNNHFSPRLGFAWDPFDDGKTVIHGAGGIFFGGIAGNEWEFPSNYS